MSSSTSAIRPRLSDSVTSPSGYLKVGGGGGSGSLGRCSGSPFATSVASRVYHHAPTATSVGLGSYLYDSSVLMPTPPNLRATPLWHNVHQSGSPEVTAFDINDRGNRVYLKFDPSVPTRFPVKETRFYKPKIELERNKIVEYGGGASGREL